MEHVHNRNVADLASQIASTLNQLPDDGKERQLTVTIGGNNHGTVVLGPQITINPEPKRVITPQEMGVTELYQMRRQYLTEIHAARHKKWRSVPGIVMLIMLVFLIGSIVWQFLPLLNGGSIHTVLSNPPTIASPLFLTAWVLMFAIAGGLFERVRRIQDRLIKNNKELIESIDVELSRKGM